LHRVEITLKDIIKIYGKESIKLIDELIEKNKILLSEEVFDYYKPIIKSYLKINKSNCYFYLLWFCTW